MAQELVAQIQTLTATRDRGLMALALVATLKQALGQGSSLCVWQREAAGQAWHSEEAAPAAPLQAQLDACAQTRSAQHLRLLDGAYRLLLPVAGAGTPHAPPDGATVLLDIQLRSAPSERELALIQGVVQIHSNLLALLDYSERDSLTGLLNRKTYDEAFLRSAAARPGTEEKAQCCVLGVLDIDHFKRVNDGFGHLIGDEVLLLVARLVRSSFRQQDGVYRFGGEEFVVLMRCGHPSDAASAFERLRASVERQLFPQVGHITVSIGFTQVPPGDTPSAAFERADKAVYHAKHSGRNQVCDHEALVAQGVFQAQSQAAEIELF